MKIDPLPKPETKIVHIRIPVDTLTAAEAYAEAKNRDLDEIVALLLQTQIASDREYQTTLKEGTNGHGRSRTA